LAVPPAPILNLAQESPTETLPFSGREFLRRRIEAREQYSLNGNTIRAGRILIRSPTTPRR